MTDHQFEQDWNSENENVRFFSEKDKAKMWWLRGRLAGITESIARIKGEPITPEDAMKVEAATIGESIRYHHLADVIEAKKHSS